MTALSRLFFLGAACLIAPAFVWAEGPASADLDPVVAEAHKCVVSVISERPGGGKWVGAGVIWDGVGNVVTLKAVVDRGERFEIVTRSGNRRGAAPGGLDEVSGIALLKASDLRGVGVKLAEASELKVGEWVVAVGSPFGSGASLGIVSQVGRMAVTRGPAWIIQTTAAVGPGDVGGLLINTRGEMVGLLSGRLVSPTVRRPLPGGSGPVQAAIELPAARQGLAVPADVVRHVAQELIAHGRVRRAWLGLSAVPARSLKATARLLPREGALVVGLVEGSPAHRGRLSIGDVLVDLAGRAVRSLADIERNLMTVAPGQKIELAVLRDGQRAWLRVEAKERSESTEQVWLCAGGLRLRENGLVVIADGGWPGVRAGDRIVAVNGRVVSDLSELQTALIAPSQRLAVIRSEELVVLPRPPAE